MKYLKRINPWVAFWLLITIVRLVVHYADLRVVTDSRLGWYWAMFAVALIFTVYSSGKEPVAEDDKE